MSAAPYAHQWQTNPSTFGLNGCPELIRVRLLLHDLFLMKRSIDLAQEVLIGKVFQEYGICRTLRAAQSIAFAENRINPGFFAMGRLVKLYGIIHTNSDTCPARYAIILFYLADGTRNGDDVI